MPYPGRAQVDRWWRRPWLPKAPRFVGWRTRLAGLLLAGGSFLTFLGPVVWLLSGDSLGFVIAVPAVAILVYAWVGLGEDIRALPGRTEGANRRKAMWVAYVVLWMGFILGMLTLPLTLSRPLGSGELPDPWGYLLLGPFVYVPTVFAPMAFAHAAIFGLGARFLPAGRGPRVTAAGTGILIVVAILGLALQVQGLFPVWGFFLAGSLGFGYLAIGLGTSRSPSRQTVSHRRIRIG